MTSHRPELLTPALRSRAFGHRSALVRSRSELAQSRVLRPRSPCPASSLQPNAITPAIVLKGRRRATPLYSKHASVHGRAQEVNILKHASNWRSCFSKTGKSSCRPARRSPGQRRRTKARRGQGPFSGCPIPRAALLLPPGDTADAQRSISESLTASPAIN